MNYMIIESMERDGRKSEVVRSLGEEPYTWGIRMYQGDNYLGIEWFPDKAMNYVRDAAENFALGIKKFP
jgi:hypothetical protein